MAKRAILLHAGEPSSVQRNIARILEFFGVPWELQAVEEFRSGAGNLGDEAVFASINVTADLITCAEPVNRLAAYGRLFFVYPGERSTLEHEATKTFCEALGLSHRYLPSGEIQLSISNEQPTLTGPMTGLTVTARATHSLVAVAKEAPESRSFESLSRQATPLFLQSFVWTVRASTFAEARRSSTSINRSMPATLM